MNEVKNIIFPHHLGYLTNPNLHLINLGMPASIFAGWSPVKQQNVDLNARDLDSWSHVHSTTREDGKVGRYFFKKDNKVTEAVVEFLADGSVDIRLPCLSGCGMLCSFCGVGENDFFRTLTTEQIQSIVRIVMQHSNVTNEHKLQFQFFSTGEPMLSPRIVFQTVRDLYQQYSQQLNEIVISTSAPLSKYESVDEPGEYGNLLALAKDVPVLQLQLSIAVDEESRNLVVRRPHKLSLAQMRDFGIRFHEVTGRKPFFNIVVTEEVGTQADLANIVRMFPPDHFDAKVSPESGSEESLSMTFGEVKILSDHTWNLSAQAHPFLAANYFIDAGYEKVRLFDPLGRTDPQLQPGCGAFPEAHAHIHEIAANR